MDFVRGKLDLLRVGGDCPLAKRLKQHSKSIRQIQELDQQTLSGLSPPTVRYRYSAEVLYPTPKSTVSPCISGRIGNIFVEAGMAPKNQYSVLLSLESFLKRVPKDQIPRLVCEWQDGSAAGRR